MDPAEDLSSATEPARAADGGNGTFATTHWSVVLALGASDPTRATAALEILCRRYWYPIYAFVRRRGADAHEAEDLTQAFFAQLIEQDVFQKADRQKGKFRTFLLAALTHFLANEWDKRRTLKRGGGHQFISLDEAAAEKSYQLEPVEPATPEKLFDRRWALLLMEATLERLKQEYAAGNKADLFAKLEPGLTDDFSAGGHASVAAVLGMNEGAVRVALHRLRRRFGELLRGEVAQTVTGPAEVDDEIRQLFSAISA